MLSTRAREWTLYAGLLVGAAYSYINVHLPTGDDWWTIINALPARGHFWELALRPWAHHWHPLFWVGPSFALTLGPGPYGVATVRALNAVALWISLGAFSSIGRALGLRRFPIAAGMFLFTFHQATVGVLRQWDSFGQLWGDTIVRCVLAMVVLSLTLDRCPWMKGPGGLVISAAAIFVGLTGTERVLGTVAGSLGWLVPVVLLALYRNRSQEAVAGRALSDRVAASRPAWALAGMSAAVVAFLVVRHRAGARAVVDNVGARYVIGSLSEIAKNFVQMVYALLTPVSTLATFNWWTSRAYWAAAVAVAITVFTGASVAVCLVRARPGNPLHLGLVAGTVAACVPTALIAHVSEHYLSAASFFFAMVFAVALDRGGLRSVGGNNGRTLVTWGVVAFLLAHVVGFLTKESAAARTGAWDLREGRRLYAALRELPAGTSFRLTRDPGAPHYYSLYDEPNAGLVVLAESVRERKGWRWGVVTSDVTIRLTTQEQYVIEKSR